MNIKLQLLAGMLLSLPLLTQAATPGELPPGLVNPGHVEAPEWFKVSFLDIREDLDEAAAEDKGLLLYFFQDGCPYCARLIETNFAQRDIAQYTQRHFDVVAINMWGDREVTDQQGETVTEKRFAERMRVMFTPTLLFLDRQGATQMRINGYYPPTRFKAALEYVAEGAVEQERFADYYRRTAPQPASGRLHQSEAFLPWPLRLDQARTRPLLVLFEQPQCPACDELHQQALTRPEVKSALEGFDVALVNRFGKQTLTTPRGETLTMRAWGDRLGVAYTPTLVFFDPAGAEVFRAEAYLRSFHIASTLEYVASGAYLRQPSFQRFVQSRADRLRETGQTVDLMR